MAQTHIKIIKTPLTEAVLTGLHAGDLVEFSGELIAARDMAHKRLVETLKKGEPLPFDLSGQIIYYTGPTPAPPGRVIGSIGPTTSGRMDRYTPALLEAGLKGMIGKGQRNPKVKEAIVRQGAVYFAAIGGAAAYMSSCVISAEVIAYEDLGPEAIRRLTVEHLPLIVINDTDGNDWYEKVKPDTGSLV